MKPLIQRIAAAAVGAVVLVAGLSACSGSHPRASVTAEKMSELRASAVGRISNKLDLDEAQRTKLNILADKLEAQRALLAGAGSGPRSDMAGLLASERFDRVRAQSLLDEKTRAVQAMGPEVINAMGDFYDSLNTQQQQKVRERLQGRQGHWMSRG